VVGASRCGGRLDSLLGRDTGSRGWDGDWGWRRHVKDMMGRGVEMEVDVEVDRADVFAGGFCFPFVLVKGRRL
jgi:hypothetical protein